MHNPLAFKIAFYEEQIYRCLFGNIKYDATISKIELRSVFFWACSQICTVSLKFHCLYWLLKLLAVDVLHFADHSQLGLWASSSSQPWELGEVIATWEERIFLLGLIEWFACRPKSSILSVAIVSLRLTRVSSFFHRCSVTLENGINEKLSSLFFAYKTSILTCIT